MADRLVAEVAGEAAAEAQRRRNGRDAMAREPGARTRTVGLDAFQADVGAARVAQEAAHRPAARLDALGACEADEGIAPEALAADHGLEQIEGTACSRA